MPERTNPCLTCGEWSGPNRVMSGEFDATFVTFCLVDHGKGDELFARLELACGHQQNFAVQTRPTEDCEAGRVFRHPPNPDAKFPQDWIVLRPA